MQGVGRLQAPSVANTARQIQHFLGEEGYDDGS